MIRTFSCKNALESIKNPMILPAFMDETDTADGKNSEYVSENQPWGLGILPQQEKRG
jgi:hypothetical protein